MSKRKRDIAILCIIGIIFYAVIYYKFVLVDALAKVEDVNSQIETAEKKKAALDNDLKNLDQLKRSLEMKNVQNERIENYLMNEADLSDNFDYVDKLIKLFNNKITEATINEPAESVSAKTSTKYYEFKIDIKAALTYDQSMNLVNYLEGGSQKVKITKFNIAAADTKGTQNPPNNTASNDNYSIEMSINLYSMNLNSLDKVYEYSRKNFLNHNPRNEDGVIFAPSSITSSIWKPSSNQGLSNPPSIPNNSSPSKNNQNLASDKDIEVRIDSFLAAGSNFSIYGKGISAYIGFKTKQKADVKITLGKEAYNVNVVDSHGQAYKLNGKTPSSDINLYIKTNFPYTIKENQYIGADISIINDSGKSVKVSLYDNNKCVTLKDRSGNVIRGNNATEKVFIL